jgi:hypothetical protein
VTQHFSPPIHNYKNPTVTIIPTVTPKNQVLKIQPASKETADKIEP